MYHELVRLRQVAQSQTADLNDVTWGNAIDIAVLKGG